jgi:hypothetical protein
MTLSDSESDAHLLKIKQEVAACYPDFQARVTKAWGEIIEELANVTDAIAKEGPEVCPSSVNFRYKRIHCLSSTYLKSAIMTYQATSHLINSRRLYAKAHWSSVTLWTTLRHLNGSLCWTTLLQPIQMLKARLKRFERPSALTVGSGMPEGNKQFFQLL